MESDFDNIYADDTRADAYAGLGFPATYSLAFRDLPDLIARHVRGTRALDFGCGAGRSTRFLRRLGLDPLGVDIAEGMLARAREREPDGDYRLVPDGDLSTLAPERFDLILCAFPFDNIPMGRKPGLLRSLGGLLAPDGRLVNLVSAPELYLHEWVSFSTRDFPGNRSADSGDVVRLVMLDVEDRRPVEDILCTDDAYRHLYEEAGLELLVTHRPLARPGDPGRWVTEERVSPWTIYVLARGP